MVNKKNPNNKKLETASELGITDTDVESVKKVKLDESEVRRIIAKTRSRFIGFK